MFCEAPVDPSECVCIALYDPVTCEDGKEYSNSCFAGCVGQTQCRPLVEEPVEEPVDEEESTETEDEDETEDPVDDKADEGQPGDREKPCPCPRIYRPVTCENDVTFPNQCLATCAGQRNCRSARDDNDEVVFDRSDFTSVIEDLQNQFNRPTGLGEDDFRGAYTDIVSEYDNDFNRPTGLGTDDENSA